MKNLILKIFLSKQERVLFEAILAARNIQDFLWGFHNDGWDYEEWLRMLRKRVVKLEQIEQDNPHKLVEIRKRLLQVIAVGVNFITKLDGNNIQDVSQHVSNLPEFSEKFVDSDVGT